MKRALMAAVLSVTLVGTGFICSAADETSKDKSADASQTAKKKQMPFRGKISAVDKVAKTVTLEGKEKSRTLQITSETKITKDGNPAVLDDVAVGESVGGLARENAAGKMEIATLNVGTKSGKARSEEKKKKEKN